MAVTKSQKRLIILLLMVVLYAVYDLFNNPEQYGSLVSSGDKKTKTELKPKVNKSANKNIESNDQVAHAQVPAKMVLNWRRNPFQRIEEKPKYKPRKIVIKEKPLTLNAITYSGENSFVIINDIILKEGELIEGYKVEKISENRVKLSKSGRIRYLDSK